MSSNTLTLRKYFIWNSQWYCDYNYYNLLFEDIKINNYLQSIFYLLKFPTSNFIIKRYFYKIIIQSNLHIMFLFNRYFNTNKLMFFFKRHKKLLINHFVFKKSVYWLFKKIAIRLYYYLFNNNVNNLIIQTKINIPVITNTDILTKYIYNKISFISNAFYSTQKRLKVICSRLRNGKPGAYQLYKSFFSYDSSVFSTLQELVLKYYKINDRYANWFQYANYNKLFTSDLKVYKKKSLFFYRLKGLVNNVSSLKEFVGTSNTHYNSLTSTLFNSVRSNSFFKISHLLNTIQLYCSSTGGHLYQSQVVINYLNYFLNKSKYLRNKYIFDSLKTSSILNSNITNTLYYNTLYSKSKSLLNSTLLFAKGHNKVLKNTYKAIHVNNNALLQFVINLINTNTIYNTQVSTIINETQTKIKGKKLVGLFNTQLVHTQNTNYYSTWVSYLYKYKASFYNNLFYSLFKKKEAFAMTYFKIFYNHYLIFYCIYKIYKVVCSNYMQRTTLSNYDVHTNTLLNGNKSKYVYTQLFKHKKAVLYNPTNKLFLKKITKHFTRGNLNTYLNNKKKLVKTFFIFKKSLKHTLLLLYYELQSVVERGECTKSKSNKLRIQIDNKKRSKISKLFFSTVTNNNTLSVRNVGVSYNKLTKGFAKKVINKKLNNTMVNVFKKYFNYYVTFNTYYKTYYVISNISKKVVQFKYRYFTIIQNNLRKSLNIIQLRKLFYYKLLLCRRRINRRRWLNICKIIYSINTIQNITNTQFLKKSNFFKLVWALSIYTISTEQSNISIQLQHNSNIAYTLILKISSYLERSVEVSKGQSSKKTVLTKSNIFTQLYKGVFNYVDKLGFLYKIDKYISNVPFLYTYMCNYYIYNKNKMYRFINNLLLLYNKQKHTNKMTVISDNLFYKSSTIILENTYVFSRQLYMFDHYRPFLKSTLESLSNTLLVRNAVVSHFLLDIYKLSSNNFLLATWLLKKYVYKYIRKLYLIIKYFIFCLIKSNTLLLGSTVNYNNYSLDILTHILECNSLLKYTQVITNYTHFFKTYSKQTYLIDYIGNSTFMSIIQNKTYYYFYIKYYIVTFWYLFYYIECSISKYSKINTFLLISYNLNWDYYLNSAKMWCEYIVFQLKKRITIRKVFWYIKKQQIREKRNSLNYILNHPQNSDILAKYKYPLKGIRILYSGNIKKAKRKQRLYYYVWLADITYSGGMPVRNIKTYIDYYYSVAVLKRASVGIKFWLLYDL